jgi:hypothetical protein
MSDGRFGHLVMRRMVGLKSAYQVHACKDAVALERRHRVAMRRQRGRSFDSPFQPSVYINEGRWLVDCPHCGSGVALVRTSDAGAGHETRGSRFTGRCFGCGAVYRGLPSPVDGDVLAALEVILLTRPIAAQNWVGESLQELVRENAVHGGLDLTAWMAWKGAVTP